MMDVLRSAELLLTKKMTKRRMYTCCDSRAALVAIATTTIESFLVWKCMQALGELSESNNAVSSLD
jgi:hypothetical protein